MNKEQKEIRCAELVAVLTDSRDILNELLAYSRQGLSVSNIVEYASLFAVLNDIEDSKNCDIAQAWNNEEDMMYFYNKLREYYSQDTNYSADYAILFDSTVVWEEHETKAKRRKQLEEIAIQAALEGVDYDTCKSFMREYELTTEEVNVFDYIYNNTIRAAEGRNRRHRRTDSNNYLAYKIRRDKELNAWCEDHGVVTPYNPNMAVDVLQKHGLFGLLGKVIVCHAKDEEEEDNNVKPCDPNKDIDDYDWGIWYNDLPF